jgi:photosystem II stability/assembly factor-like uncharacterized protein
MSTLRTALASAAFVATTLAAPATGAAFVDVLDTPARVSPLASRGLLQAVTKAGDKLVAVGQRGHIVVSADAGASWKQSPVPVSSDLTAVFFVNAQKGWVVGHDGVILHTSDGGNTWTLQFDGRRANQRLVQHMQERVAATPQSTEKKQLLDDAKRYKEQGADKPFLDVWFSDESRGFAVGAYNLIFHTADGGKSWEPWFDQTDNPKLFNLYAIRPAAGGVYIVGEGGLVLKLDADGRRFKALEVPYNGSFFGVVDAGSAVVIYGLRGNVYRSDDGGAAWAKVDAGLAASVVGAARTQQGATLLVDVAGRVASSSDGGRTFTKLALKQPMPATGIVEVADGKLAVVGPRGAAVSEVVSR